MVLNTEKRRKLAELVSRCKVALAHVGASTPMGTSPAATSAPISPDPAPIDHRQKGVVEVAASEDEDTFFKRKRAPGVVAPSHSASDCGTPSFIENSLSTSSPRDLVVLKGGERAPLKVITACLLLLICPPSSSSLSSASKTGRWWRA